MLEKPMTASDLLARMATLIETGHARGAMARDIHGEVTLPGCDDAAAWCLLGARTRVLQEMSGLNRWEFSPEAQELSAKVCSALMICILREKGTEAGYGLALYSDTHTKEQVLTLIQKAKEELERRTHGG